MAYWLLAVIRWLGTLIKPTPPTMPPEPQNSPVQPVPTVPESDNANGLKLVAAAKSCLGKDLSAGTGVPSYVACAISVNRVHALAFGKPLGGGASTFEMYKAIQKNSDWYETDEKDARPGAIVICPSGYGENPHYPHGHVAILGEHGLCANDSATGLWTESYPSIAAWKDQFERLEKYPTYYFNPR